ncbi:hypothetical protein [Frigoriglobus tundricola]|uniref:Uncharacterized protein n=1 Tax=Frigoriglobus tundricola TaxID=2774151 RepID=A0A6M5YMW4_9BACT|nr:hypothetical protein [Frigoriglobus tundricola]QJW94700.1 hypothetical protein FTUN_2222 [Frigoriglobus tundricola]
MDKVKVEMLANMSGHNHSWNTGDIVEMPRAKAEGLVRAGFAKPVDEGEEPKPKKVKQG